MQFCAPDDGRKTRLKHVEHLTVINILRNVAACCLYSENKIVLFSMFITILNSYWNRLPYFFFYFFIEHAPLLIVILHAIFTISI